MDTIPFQNSDSPNPSKGKRLKKIIGYIFFCSNYNKMIHVFTFKKASYLSIKTGRNKCKMRTLYVQCNVHLTNVIVVCTTKVRHNQADRLEVWCPFRWHRTARRRSKPVPWHPHCGALQDIQKYNLVSSIGDSIRSFRLYMYSKSSSKIFE